MTNNENHEHKLLGQRLLFSSVGREEIRAKVVTIDDKTTRYTT